MAVLRRESGRRLRRRRCRRHHRPAAGCGLARALRQIEHFAAGVADADECQRAFFARAGRVEQGLRERQRVGEVGVAVEQVQHRVARRRCLADGGGLDAVTAPAVGGSDGGFGGLRQLRGLPVGDGRAERGSKEEGFFHKRVSVAVIVGFYPPLSRDGYEKSPHDAGFSRVNIYRMT